MMKVSILAISKNKQEFISEGEREYLKRLSKYADVDIQYLKEEPITKSSDHDYILEAEGDRICQHLNSDAVTIALHVMGKECTSYQFSELLTEIKDFKGGKVQFIIGGPLGLSQKVLKAVTMTISLSKMTFTHQLVRLLLLEQIYRGFEIAAGTEYHK